MFIDKLRIKILVVEKDKDPYVKMIRNRLEHFRKKLVGGENLDICYIG